MAHFHEDSDTYYLDQLCLIALSAAFGGVCLTLYFWNTVMLKLMLGPQFHDMVGISGFVLLGFAGLRSVILWRRVGLVKSSHAHEHVHDHHHVHDHDHGHGPGCGHDHSHEHTRAAEAAEAHSAAAEHVHAHEHAIQAGNPPHVHSHGPGHEHGHEHGHDHDHGDHDHSWAPWRYVVLLLPVFMYMLGLPNKDLSVQAQDIQISSHEKEIAYAGLVALAHHPMAAALVMRRPENGAAEDWILLDGVTQAGSGGNVQWYEFSKLETAPTSDADVQGKWVRVTGRFAWDPLRNANDRVFSLIRFRISCCAGDAIPLSIPVVTKESLNNRDARIKSGDWVEVIGRVEFRTIGGSSKTILQVPTLKNIKPTAADSNPYVQ